MGSLESRPKNEHIAVFLDRDGTLSSNSERIGQERDAVISRLVGHEFTLTREIHDRAFWPVFNDPEIKPVNTVEREDRFWRRFYRTILEQQGIGPKAAALAEELFERFCY